MFIRHVIFVAMGSLVGSVQHVTDTCSPDCPIEHEIATSLPIAAMPVQEVERDTSLNFVTALYHFNALGPGTIPVVLGEELEVISTTTDGWALVRRTDKDAKDEGYVPMSFLSLSPRDNELRYFLQCTVMRVFQMKIVVNDAH